VQLDFADKIIIVDSYSNDNMRIVSESFVNVKFIQNLFENYSAQRNFVIDLGSFIDADERLTAELKQKL
jgi:hypothetical protein